MSVNTRNANWNRIAAAAMVLLMILFASITPAFASQKGSSMSKAELKALIVMAKTPEEHQKIADYYLGKAARFDAEAREHAQMAAEYDKHPTGREQKQPLAPATATHCRDLSERFAGLAKEARGLAAEHQEMARQAEKANQ